MQEEVSRREEELAAARKAAAVDLAEAQDRRCQDVERLEAALATKHGELHESQGEVSHLKMLLEEAYQAHAAETSELVAQVGSPYP